MKTLILLCALALPAAAHTSPGQRRHRKGRPRSQRPDDPRRRRPRHRPPLQLYAAQLTAAPIVLNGKLFLTREAALDSVKANARGGATVKYRWKNLQVTVISPTTALLVADGESEIRPIADSRRPDRRALRAERPLRAVGRQVARAARAPIGAAAVIRGMDDYFALQQIREHAVRARHARRQLPEPRVRREDVDSLAVARPDFAAFQRRLAGIVRGQHGLIPRVPPDREVHAALLHPAVEILRVDVIRILQQRAVRMGEL